MQENYQFSHFIAEVANSFSNLVTVWFAVHGARKALENRLPARLWLAQLVLIYKLCSECNLPYVQGFALVGLGSFAFHATLLYEAQLADELPMIYVAAYSTYTLYDTEPGWSISSRRNSTLLGMLLGFTTAFTAT
jgi:dihydroceramidase